MGKRNRFNMVGRLQGWMDSVAGQTFLNYAYSWGAAVVILGTLFKLTHLPYANLFLYLGMGTEVLVFFISAFDRPFSRVTEHRNDNHETGTEIQDVVEKLRTAYLKQVDMVKEQQLETERMNGQIQMQNIYMRELNKVYANILKAVGGYPTAQSNNVERNRL